MAKNGAINLPGNRGLAAARQIRRPVGFRTVGRDVGERKRLEHDLLESYKNVQTARAATILGLAKLAEYRDEDTGTHLERIREYARIIARELAHQPRISRLYHPGVHRRYLQLGHSA